jgi:hypothetical protein
VLGDAAPGETCNYDGVVEATDDCDAASHCWDVMDVDGELMGVCAPFCMGSYDQPVCPRGTSCLIANDQSITLCIKTCDPFLQDCGPGLACFQVNGHFNCIFTGDDPEPPGQPCRFMDCSPGQYCAFAELVPGCEASACCTPYCDLDGDANCDALPGTSCVPFFEPGMAPSGYEHIGVCIAAEGP